MGYLHQKRILLIEPPFNRLYNNLYSLVRYPLSLGYLSAAIKNETNWDVVAYNADFNPQYEQRIKLSYQFGIGYDNYLRNLKSLSQPIWEEVKSTILEYNPTVVGISAKSQNFASACIVAKLAKTIDSNIVVVVGGSHPSMVGAEVLNCPDIDICVKGEGEKTIVDLLNTISTNGQLDAIKGIIFRKNGQIIENGYREYIANLDGLVFPYKYASKVLKDYNKYPVTAFRNIFATRGCPYNCFFCGSSQVWSRQVRFRSPENVASEIKLLKDGGVKYIHFDDDTFGINKKYISELCNAITKYCPVTKWSCELHVKLVNDEVISIMKKSGCYSIQIGIESGNNEILKKIRKGLTIEEGILAAKIIKKYGIELQTFFMVGFPWDTEETLHDTAKAIKKISSDSIIYNIFTPYPGTESFKFCKDNGLIDKNYDVSLFNHQSPANCFCLNIPHDKFRILVTRMERMLDRKNYLRRIKRIFSFAYIGKIKELGIKKCSKEALKILIMK